GDEGQGVCEDGGSHPPQAQLDGGRRPQALRRGGRTPLRRRLHPAVPRPARREGAQGDGRQGGDGGLVPVRGGHDGGEGGGGEGRYRQRRLGDRRGDEHLEVSLGRVLLRGRGAREPQRRGQRRCDEQRPERRRLEGHHRGGVPHGRDEASGRADRGVQRRGLRQDLDGLRAGRGHPGGRLPAPGGGARGALGQGFGRHQDAGGCHRDAERGGFEARDQRERGYHGGSREWRSTRV
ncbi:MAG: Deoxyribose-phosphate aldolase, partial [uncultured Rubrobacteraceae bacterium]